jgi:hypothetical protein
VGRCCGWWLGEGKDRFANVKKNIFRLRIQAERNIARARSRRARELRRCELMIANGLVLSDRSHCQTRYPYLKKRLEHEERESPL